MSQAFWCVNQERTFVNWESDVTVGDSQSSWDEARYDLYHSCQQPRSKACVTVVQIFPKPERANQFPWNWTSNFTKIRSTVLELLHAHRHGEANNTVQLLAANKPTNIPRFEGRRFLGKLVERGQWGTHAPQTGEQYQPTGTTRRYEPKRTGERVQRRFCLAILLYPQEWFRAVPSKGI